MISFFFLLIFKYLPFSLLFIEIQNEDEIYMRRIFGHV